MQNNSIFLLMLWLITLGCGSSIKIKHQIEPIFVTVDVNIKVQKELEDFFGFEDSIKESQEKMVEEQWEE